MPAMKLQEAGVKNAVSETGTDTMLLTLLALDSAELLL